MGFLAVVLVLWGAIDVLNPLLMFGVIRALREHNKMPTNGGGGTQQAATMIGVGELSGPFSATLVDGKSISRDQFADPILIGAFRAGCKA